jgi:hypothetical protein
VELVVINDASTITTASILSGFAGALLGGIWVGGALFVASSYFGRKDTDVSLALKGVATSVLETLNFGGQIADKYKVTDKIGGTLSDAVSNVKASAGDNEAVNTVVGVFDGAAKAVGDLDKEVGIKDSLGNAVSSASELASEAVEKAVEVNQEYKITDTVVEKAQEVVNQTQEKLK